MDDQKGNFGRSRSQGTQERYQEKLKRVDTDTQDMYRRQKESTFAQNDQESFRDKMAQFEQDSRSAIGKMKSKQYQTS